MSQQCDLSFWGSPAVPQVAPVLRWYQREAVESILEDLKQTRKTVCVMATGLGKTQIFCRLAVDWITRNDSDVLVLAHRDELVMQAVNRFRQFGVEADIEQAELKASPYARVVVASVNTLRSKKRLAGFRPDRFGLVIADEVHHYVGNTYVRPLEYFDSSLQVGFTATPDRSDDQALGKQWDSVAYVRDILEAIDDGYLVPVRARRVRVKSIDLSSIKKQAGDLPAGALDEAMIRAVDPVVDKVIEYESHRRGICFFPGVRTASLACERFNHYSPGSAAFISGTTPTEERRRIIAECHSGHIRYLCACMVPTEGFDWPACDLIVQARPTLSRALYTQMVGRGTRPLPGVVDQHLAREDNEKRREAIRCSSKQDVMVLDFVGVTGQHDLVTSLDVLGGSFNDEERALAKRKAKEKKAQGKDQVSLLREARHELDRLKALRALIEADVVDVNPFHVLGVKKSSSHYMDYKFGKTPITLSQLDYLESALTMKRGGMSRDDLAKLSMREAKALIIELRQRRAEGLATYKQLAVLREYGWDDKNITMAQAKAGLDLVSSRGWRHGDIDTSELCRVIAREGIKGKR
jgi:superfamily II DNA or RNA helicase